MTKQNYLIQFELKFSQHYSKSDIKEYCRDKLKSFYTIKNLIVSKI